jgi:hypothetical protein
LPKKTNLKRPRHQTLKNHLHPNNHRRYHRTVARFDTAASSKDHPVINPLTNFSLSWQPTSQDVLGKDVSLTAWDKEQTKAFPPVKSPQKLPQSRESLSIYLGTYVNPKTEGSKVYLNLRLVTTKAHQVPLAQFGMKRADQFASSKYRMSFQRQPRARQASKSECIGWMMYSCKSMNSNTFIPAIKKAVNIPDMVTIVWEYPLLANDGYD